MAEEYGKIRKSLLTGIADAIRAKKVTTALFSPEQMAAEIDGIVVGDNLPEAENYSFGKLTAYEEMVARFSSVSNSTSYGWTSGYKFTVNNDFAIYGCKVYGGCGSIRIWDDADRSAVFTQAVNTNIASWETVMFSTPVNLFAGKTYMITRSPYSNGYGGAFKYPALNSKVTQVGRGFYGGSTIDTYPTSDAYYQNGMAGAIIPLIGPVITESEIEEYKIQTTTLTDIADEVKRVTGKGSTLTPAQIITVLQALATQNAVLPPIPADVLASYPYAWIRNNTRTGYYDLLLSQEPWYLQDENTLAKSVEATKWYQISISSADTAEAWTFNSDYDSLEWGNESDRRIMWSNHDIPNGSADATDIYFAASPLIV